MDEIPIEPESFDLIVLGTGLVESLVAGAAARNGKTVLHLDHADNYGSQWASLTLDALCEFVDRHVASVPTSPGGGSGAAAAAQTADSERFVDVELDKWTADLYADFFVDDVAGPEHREVLKAPRRYSIDLCGPKMPYCQEEVVDILVHSGAHQYLEFKALEAVLLWSGAALAPVPSSRAEVFRDRTLSAPQKRILMRFLQAVHACGPEAPPLTLPSEGGAHYAETFVDLLRRNQITGKLQEVVLYTIALLGPDPNSPDGSVRPVSAEEGLAAVRLYLSSVGRFGQGQGAFLLPLYGMGEMPQAFCRVAAVNGAVYVLRRPVAALQLTRAPPEVTSEGDSEAEAGPSDTSSAGRGLRGPESGGPAAQAVWRCGGVRTQGGQVLRCDALVTSPAFRRAFPTAPGAGEAGQHWVQRCICITDRSLAEGQTQVLAVFPPAQDTAAQTTATWHPASTIRALQVGEASLSAPEGRFIVYLSTTAGPATCAQPSSSGSASPSLPAQFQPLRDAVDHLFTRFQAPPAPPPPQPESPAAGASPAAAAATSDSEHSTAPDSEEGGVAGAGPVESGAEVGAEAAPGGAAAEPAPRPALLWAVYFSQRVCDAQCVGGGEGEVSNVGVAGSPDATLDLQHALKEARQIFAHLYPTAEFFPKKEEDPDADADDGDDNIDFEDQPSLED